MKINLQKFGETDPEGNDSRSAFDKLIDMFKGTPPEEHVESKPEEPETEPEANPEDKPETNPEDKPVDEPEEEFITIKHLGKEVRIPAKDRDAYIQKGYDYDFVKEKLGKKEDVLKRIALVEGYKTVDDFLAELNIREKAKLAEQIEEAAGDPTRIDDIVKNHPEVVKTREERKRLEFDKARAELSKDRFFAELEPEFNRLVEQNPDAKPDLVYKLIRSDYLTHDKLDELMSKERKATETKVLADVHDKAKRSQPTGGDAEGDEPLPQPTSEMSEIAAVFGLSPAKLAQRAAKSKKRS